MVSLASIGCVANLADSLLNLAVKREQQGQKSLAKELAAIFRVSSGIMPCLPQRKMYCFNFVTRLISPFLLFHINKIHLVNAQTE